MTPHDPVDHEAVWREVTAAVAYLAATAQPGLMVWDALAEAARVWVDNLLDTDTQTDQAERWDDPDPLRTSLIALLAATAPAGSPGAVPLGDILTAALTAWVRAAAEDANDGYPFTARP